MIEPDTLGHCPVNWIYLSTLNPPLSKGRSFFIQTWRRMEEP